MTEDQAQPEVLEVEEDVKADLPVPVVSPNPDLAQLMAAARDAPRSVTRCIDELEQLICQQREFCDRAVYVLKRWDPKKGTVLIPGPSVHFASMLQYTWANLAVSSQPKLVGPTFLEAEGMAIDAEKRTIQRVTARTKILYGKKSKRAGQRYSDDMVETTMLATQAKAMRNAILRVVPWVFWLPVYEKAYEILQGNVKDSRADWSKVCDAFGPHGLAPEDLLQLLGHESAADVAPADIVTLRTLYKQVSDGETDVATLLEKPEEGQAMGSLAEKLAEKRGESAT